MEIFFLSLQKLFYALFNQPDLFRLGFGQAHGWFANLNQTINSILMHDIGIIIDNRSNSYHWNIIFFGNFGYPNWRLSVDSLTIDLPFTGNDQICIFNSLFEFYYLNDNLNARSKLCIQKCH